MRKRKVAIFSPKMAINDFNKKLLQFTDMVGRVRTNEDRMMAKQPQNQNNETSLESYLMTMGLPASSASKIALAKEMGYTGYVGTPEQDRTLMQVLEGRNQKFNDQAKNQRETQNSQIDNEFKNKEFALKEREMDLREAEVNNNKPASPEEIAQQLLSKIK